MSENEQGQVTRSAAEIYEEVFVPALFQQWAGRVADAAHLKAGDRVLDVACGTGVLARAAAERVAPNGRVAGLDRNEGMLAVARRKAPQIEWKEGVAEKLPFDDTTFDAVVSQFGLMFFEDRHAALREMLRVLRPGGRLAIAVWDSLEHSDGYKVMRDLLQRLFGADIAKALDAPFVLGDTDMLRALFAEAGIPDIHISTEDGMARYPSLQDMIYTEIKAWTLADALNDAQFQELTTQAAQTFKPFTAADGSIAFHAPAHIITASREA